MERDPAAALREVASGLGVQPGHHDVFGQWHDISPRALVAVTAALAGVPGANGNEAVEAGREELRRRAARPVAPTLVAWEGRPAPVEMRLAPHVTHVEVGFEADPRSAPGPAAPTVRVELARNALAVGAAGGRRTWMLDLTSPAFSSLLPVPLPTGRHTLSFELEGEVVTSTVLAAPRRLVRLGDEQRLWGVVAPLHSLWTDARPEPHLGHLARLGEWLASLGGSVVATLPLLATFLDRPCDPSPYQPVSRRWWNETYLDLRSRPELAESPEAQAVLDAHRVDPTAAFDAPALARRQREAIGLLAASVDRNGGPIRDGLDAFAAANPDAVLYSRFRAMVERTGTGWHGWGGDLAVAEDDPAARAHLYAQWALERQLSRLASELSRRGQRLQLDLALGAHPDGYDTWVDRDQFGWGASAGAPPDEFFVGGQSWGFPPLSPYASSETGHRHLAQSLAAHMAVAGMLRIDHVMGLHRLWWVPDGLGPTEGAYVSYPTEEMFATVAVEAHLSGCVVVGEDLGTVPAEVTRAMADSAMLGTWVAQFSQGDVPGDRMAQPGHEVVAMVGTHDTPTWASWLRARDVDLYRDLDMVDESWAATERSRRAAQVSNLSATLVEAALLDPAVGDLAGSEEATRAGHTALARFMGDSDAAVVLVSLDDLEGESEPQNVPGTPSDRPNWVLRLRRSLGDLEHDEELRSRLLAIQHSRLGSWGRTQH